MKLNPSKVALTLGFERIYKEIEKFKDTHFPAGSEYPNHSTIRGIL